MVGKTYLGILRKCFIIGIEDVTTTLDDMHGNLVSQDPRECMKQVLVQQVKQLRREFNASRSATTDNKREQTLALLIAGGG